MTKPSISESSPEVNKYAIPDAPSLRRTRHCHSNRYASIAFRHLKLTKERLEMLLVYNPLTGIFTWKSSGKSPYIDHPDGFDKNNGPHSITVDGNRYSSARLAHLYMTGFLPKGIHIVYLNGCKQDTAWANLVFIHKDKKDKPPLKWEDIDV